MNSERVDVKKSASIKLKSRCYDILKIFAMCLVVAGHVTVMFSGDGAFVPSSLSPALTRVTAFIYSFHMPLFMILSGCVFGYCLENGTYKNGTEFFKEKVRRLIIPYFFTGFVFVAPIMVFCGLTDDFQQYCVRGILLSENSRHLWYLLALFWIFLLAAAVKRLMFSHPGLLLVISVGIFCFSLMVKAHAQKNYMQLTQAGYYQVFFFIGAYLNRIFESMARWCSKWKILVFCVSAGLFYLVWEISGSGGVGMKLCCAALGSAASILSVAAAAGAELSSGGEKQKAEGWMRSVLFPWAKQNMFAIYLFHPMMNYLIFYYLKDIDIDPFLCSFLTVPIIVVLSAAMGELMRMMRLNVLIGEWPALMNRLAEDAENDKGLALAGESPADERREGVRINRTNWENAESY